MTAAVLTRVDGAIGIVTLNRPEKLNAWDSGMRGELVAALEQFGADAAIGAIILTGQGDRAFGAGQDLNETKSFDAARAEEWMQEWRRLFGAIRSLDKPIIAALNGVAAGSAFQVALLCDLRVGHAGVRMGQPEIKSGIPSVTGPWVMIDRIGLSRTIDLTLTGRLMDGEECHSIGLIQRLVPAAEVMPTAIALARDLAAMPPVAMKLNKQRFRALTEPGFDEAITAGAAAQSQAYATGEPARMMAAFFAARGKAPDAG